MGTCLLRGGVVSALFVCWAIPGSAQTFSPLDQKSLVSGRSGIDSLSAWIRNLDDIDGREIQALAEVLCGESFEGRGAGSRGFDRAARWVAEEMQRNALVPAGSDSSLFQFFRLANSDIRKRTHSMVPESDSSTTMNVVALWPGSDDSLRSEYVVLTAHLDHLGMKGDTIFRGANDNASGVSVLLRVAGYLREHHVRFKRSVAFIAFSGEEVGLKGSEYFVRKPLVPLDRIRILINLDLVGSGQNGFMLQGSENWPHLESAIAHINEQFFGFEMKTRPNSPNSDHYPFNVSGVPAFFIYAYNGTVPYHSAEDTPDKLDRAVLENITKLILLITDRFADTERY